MRFHVIIRSTKTNWMFDHWVEEDGVIEAEENVCQIAGFPSARAAREKSYEVLAELPPIHALVS